jgi:hypothetical protein
VLTDVQRKLTMMNCIHYTKPDTAQAFFRMEGRLIDSESTGGGLPRHFRPRSNIPASPPRDPEVPTGPDSPIKPGIPHVPDELPDETPPEIEEPGPDVIPVPVSEPPVALGGRVFAELRRVHNSCRHI